MTEYGRQLLEKQKLKAIYGLREQQMRRLFGRARKAAGRTGDALIVALECRLDNLLYRLGFAPTLPAARQLVVHGHVEVNGEKVDIPSFQVRPGQAIAIREKSKSLDLVGRAVEERQGDVPPYLSVDRERREGRLERLPTREEVPIQVEESLVVEFYSR